MQRVRQVLLEQGIPSKISEVEVGDETIARAVEFLGSPTVRINGVDVEPGVERTGQAGLCCRTYIENGKRVGLPPQDLIRQAVLSTAASEAGENRI